MDQTHENVSYLIEELVDFRKRAPHEISDIYARNNKEILRCLKEIKIDLTLHDEANCQMPDNPFENINIKQLHQLDEKLLEKMYEQIQLLSILIKKKDCPISRMIDEI